MSGAGVGETPNAAFAALSARFSTGELMDHKLTLIKRRLQLGRRAQLRRRVHHQCRPRQCSRQGPATGGRDEQGDTSCVTLQDRRRFFHFFHLILEADEQGDHRQSALILVLQEAEFSRCRPQIEATMGELTGGEVTLA